MPVCPLCNTPVPVRRGEMPDAVVGEHIDRDCRSDPAQRQHKVGTPGTPWPGDPSSGGGGAGKGSAGGWLRVAPRGSPLSATAARRSSPTSA